MMAPLWPTPSSGIMSDADVRRWRDRWLVEMRDAADCRNWELWHVMGVRVWALEFILRFDLPHPNERIPFPLRGGSDDKA
jgi:hypothetical protein